MTPTSGATRATGKKSVSRLRHDAEHEVCAAGCATCIDRETCGGVFNSSLFDCRIHCCGDPQSCSRVCRRNHLFKSHMQEMRGFSLQNVTVNGAPSTPPFPAYVPMLYHGYKRAEPLSAPAVAIKLAQMFDKRTGTLRFPSRASLVEAFAITGDTRIIVSGVDEDPVIERWWGIGYKARMEIIAGFRDLGIDLVTGPNFTLCLDWPRTGDLAAMKRIALCYAELINAGQPTTLHVNGRTDRDFERWSRFIDRHEAVTALSYEFTTGAARGETRDRHIGWLRSLAKQAPRPLAIVLYGDHRVADELGNVFASTTWIDTTTFMKTVHRFVAERQGNRGLGWIKRPSAPQDPIHDRLATNIQERREWYSVRGTGLEQR